MSLVSALSSKTTQKALVFGFLILFLAPSIQTYDSYFTLLTRFPNIATLFKGVVFVLFLAFIVFDCWLFKIRIRSDIVIFVSLFLITSIVSLLTNINNQLYVVGGDPLTIHQTPSALLSSFLSTARNAAMILFFVSILPGIFTAKDLISLARGFVLFSLFALSYSLIFEGTNLISIIANNTTGYSSEITSFFTNKNTFGIILFIGCCACLFCGLKNLFLCYSISTLFTVYCFLIYCRTTFLICFLMIFCHICFLSNARKRTIFIVVVPAIVVGAALIALSFLPLFESFFLFRFIKNAVTAFIKSLLDGNGRTDIWFNAFFYMMKPEKVMFGFGDEIAGDLLFSLESHMYTLSYKAHTSFHNGVIGQLMNGGISRLFLYAFGIYNFSLKKSIQKKTKICRTAILCLLCFLVYQSLEEILLLTSNSVSWFLNVLFFSIPMSADSSFELPAREPERSPRAFPFTHYRF